MFSPTHTPDPCCVRCAPQLDTASGSSYTGGRFGEFIVSLGLGVGLPLCALRMGMHAVHTLRPVASPPVRRKPAVEGGSPVIDTWWLAGGKGGRGARVAGPVNGITVCLGNLRRCWWQHGAPPRR